MYHPEALPPDSDLCLNEIFSSVAPETPLAIVDPQQKSDSISVTHKSDLTVTTPTVSEISTMQDSLPVTPPTQLSSGNTRNSASSGKESIVSKYLISPIASTPCTKKPAPRARLLTSADSLAQLEKKERKKLEEQELKEQRKREREERKKKREDELKQKAAERAKREEERAWKKARMEEERVKKAEMKAKKAVSKAEESRKKKGTKQVSSNSAREPSASTSSAQTERTSNLRSNRPAPAKTPENEINVNVCCMCFAKYEDDILSGSGAEWISCSCGRWLHEECAEDCVIDINGKERLCSLCLEFFS